MPDPRVAAAAWLKAFADPTRLRLVPRLLRGPAASGELALAVGRSVGAASAHLLMLRRCGVVERTRAGSRMIYTLACRVTRRERRVTLHGPGVRIHIEVAGAAK